MSPLQIIPLASAKAWTFSKGNGRHMVGRDGPCCDLLPSGDVFEHRRRWLSRCAVRKAQTQSHSGRGDPLFRRIAVRPFRRGYHDVRTGDKHANEELGRFLARALDALMAPGGLVLANQKLHAARWTRLPEPPGVKPDRYFIYRVGD